MALQVEYEDRYGTLHPKSYWKITNLNINYTGKFANVVITGWKDKEAKTKGKLQLDDKQFNIGAEVDIYDEGDARAIIYEYLKTAKEGMKYIGINDKEDERQQPFEKALDV